MELDRVHPTLHRTKDQLDDSSPEQGDISGSLEETEKTPEHPASNPALQLYPIFEHNDLVRNIRYRIKKGQGTMLSLRQQKVWSILLSSIKPDAVSTAPIVFDINDFCMKAGIPTNRGNRYERVREDLESIMRKVIWIQDSFTGDLISMRYIVNVHISPRSSQVLVYLDQNMAGLLIGLTGNFTKTYPQSILPMRSKYAGPLYRYLKSYVFQTNTHTVDITELQERLDSAKYKPTDFRKRVLEPAVSDINTYCSDLKVEYRIVWGKGSNKTTVEFKITDLEHSTESGDMEEAQKRFDNAEEALYANRTEQLSIWD